MAERRPLAESTEDRERMRARVRGVNDNELSTLADRTIWVMSGRVDDRVVLFERDPRHPHGEAFIGGSTPSQVFRTNEVERLMLSGELVDVPAPLATVRVNVDGELLEVANRKYPIDPGIEPGVTLADQPGRPTQLGRAMDAELWDDQSIRDVQLRLMGKPKEVRLAPGGTVPRLADVDRPA